MRIAHSTEVILKTIIAHFLLFVSESITARHAYCAVLPKQGAVLWARHDSKATLTTTAGRGMEINTPQNITTTFK